MAHIAISELRPAGVDLFDGSESFMMDLSEDELGIVGGGTPAVAIASSQNCAAAAAFVVGAVIGWLAN